jgi:hypothetical protein
MRGESSRREDEHCRGFRREQREGQRSRWNEIRVIL